MGMIFTHGIADDTGAFTMRLVRTVVQFDHGIQDTSLHRFQPIPYIRKSTGNNDAHSIIDIGFFHGLFQIDVMDFVKNIVLHVSSS